MEEESQTPETDENQPPAQASPEVKAEPQPHFAFIEHLISSLKVEAWDQSFRLSPHGLFVERSAVQHCLELYQAWQKARSENHSEQSSEKIFKKLFGSDKPKRLYLQEGKRALDVFLVPCEIANAANYRVPYYLGSPSRASDTLFPSDPIFEAIPELKAKQGKSGLEITMTLKWGEYSVPVMGLQRFRALARGSLKVAKLFPNFEESLSETLRACFGVLKKSRYTPADHEPMRPLRFARDANKYECRESQGFYFLFDENKSLVYAYHIYGRNLYALIRDEIALGLAREAHGHIGSFEIFNRKDQLVGALEVHGTRLAVHGHAMQGFISELIKNPHPDKKLKGPRTIRSYIEEFISTVQLAEPVSFDKVASYLKPEHRKHHTFLVNQLWLFVYNSRWIITDCITRTGKNRRE